MAALKLSSRRSATARIGSTWRTSGSPAPTCRFLTPKFRSQIVDRTSTTSDQWRLRGVESQPPGCQGRNSHPLDRGSVNTIPHNPLTISRFGTFMATPSRKAVRNMYTSFGQSFRSPAPAPGRRPNLRLHNDLHLAAQQDVALDVDWLACKRATGMLDLESSLLLEGDLRIEAGRLPGRNEASSQDHDNHQAGHQQVRPGVPRSHTMQHGAQRTSRHSGDHQAEG
jgi:hypothetical protein